jgi:hypothetical protein
MRRINCFLAVLVLPLLLHAPLVAADELFESDEPLAFSIEAPFAKVRKDRDKSESYAGHLTLGEEVFDIEVSVRGNRRLDKTVCRNPPLWIDFNPEQIKKTQFSHQKSIKLVVLCKPSKSYIDYLRAEYLVYKLYNLVTPYSYSARWVEVTFIEAKKTRTESAFFIERKGRLAKRVGLAKTDVERIKNSELEPLMTALVTLFQYMVSNVDYSLVTAVEGTCCHNAKLMQNEAGQYVPMIYDFDSSGLVNARYAVPAESLKIDKVTDRLFRGYCRHNGQLADARAKLLELEDQMMAMITGDPVISPKGGKKMSKFLAKSFDIIREDKNYNKRVLGACRGKA